MPLPETFESVRPSIIAFISRVVRPNPGEPPVFPPIIGTGFFVHNSGIAATNRHVINALEDLNRMPANPKTGAAAIGALVFTEIASSHEGQEMGILNVDLLTWNALERFEASGEWFGEEIPDLGFVQVNLREVPTLRLATDDHLLRVGTSIATAGFPDSTKTITYHKKITQLTPVLRHGIISSVFPFQGANPHGFSIDTLLQGGASGSPVFLASEPLVIGMIASQIPGTNYTVGVPSNLLAAALTSVRHNWPNFRNLPTMRDLIAAGEATPRNDTLHWDEYPIPKEG